MGFWYPSCGTWASCCFFMAFWQAALFPYWFSVWLPFSLCWHQWLHRCHLKAWETISETHNLKMRFQWRDVSNYKSKYWFKKISKVKCYCKHFKSIHYGFQNIHPGAWVIGKHFHFRLILPKCDGAFLKSQHPRGWGRRIMSLRQAWATQRDPASKQNNNNNNTKA